MAKRFFFSLILILFFVCRLHAQTDDGIYTSTTPSNKVLKTDTSKLQKPNKAIFRSAVLPGWGQLKNGRWWKVPLIYGGFVGLGLTYEFNQRFYKIYIDEIKFREQNNGQPGNPIYANASVAQLTEGQLFYRRNKELTIIGTFAFYTLQVVDAYIDAKLLRFDVSDDLSIRVKPDIIIPVYAAGGYATPPILAIKLQIKL